MNEYLIRSGTINAVSKDTTFSVEGNPSVEESLGNPENTVVQEMPFWGDFARRMACVHAQPDWITDTDIEGWETGIL